MHLYWKRLINLLVAATALGFALNAAAQSDPVDIPPDLSAPQETIPSAAEPEITDDDILLYNELILKEIQTLIVDQELMRQLYQERLCDLLLAELEPIEGGEEDDSKLEIYANLQMEGTCVDQDYAAAADLYEHIIEQTFLMLRTGRPEARLGTLYLNGWGRSRNVDHAEKLFVRAAVTQFILNSIDAAVYPRDIGRPEEPLMTSWMPGPPKNKELYWHILESIPWRGFERDLLKRNELLYPTSGQFAHAVTGAWTLPDRLLETITRIRMKVKNGPEALFHFFMGLRHGRNEMQDKDLALRVLIELTYMYYAPAEYEYALWLRQPTFAESLHPDHPELKISSATISQADRLLELAARRGYPAAALAMAARVLTIESYPDANVAAYYWALKSCVAQEKWPAAIGVAADSVTQADRALVWNWVKMDELLRDEFSSDSFRLGITPCLIE